MPNYVITHVPHASTDIRFREHYAGDVDAELALVTDFATDQMINADETVTFPYSRLWCDVERLIDDPLEARGHGMFVTRRLNGDVLREAKEPFLGQAKVDYADHHNKVVNAIAGAISLMPVCLLDVHSYSAEQAELSGHGEPYPDICLGFDEVPAGLIDAIEPLFIDAGYTVDRNHPYQGALVPHAFADDRDFFAVMIEVNKVVYLDAGQIMTDRFDTLKGVLDQVVAVIRAFPIGA